MKPKGRLMGNPQKSRSGGDELHTAARSGDLNAVQSILSSNPLAVNSRDKHSRTPLHLAAWSGQAEVVSYLCNHKADVGAAAMDDMGAMHFAAQKGHLNVVKALVAAGASVKAFTRKGMTPLHYAVQGSHLELVKYLVKKGASLNAKTRAGQTLLDLAANEEIRSALEESERSAENEESSVNKKVEEEESERSAKNGESSSNKKVEESKPKISASEVEDNMGIEPSATAIDEENNDREKRKNSGDDNIREASSETKKARVKLSHLQSLDDAQEEEEEM